LQIIAKNGAQRGTVRISPGGNIDFPNDKARVRPSPFFAQAFEFVDGDGWEDGPKDVGHRHLRVCLGGVAGLWPQEQSVDRISYKGRRFLFVEVASVLE